MLASSIREYGAGRSILIDKNNRIIAGNKTVEGASAAALKSVRIIESRGDELVAVKRIDLDLERDPKAKALAIADNRVAEVSLDWDAAVLENLGKELDLSQFFSEPEIGALLASLDRASGAIDDAPEPPKKPKTKRGDLIELGSHRLLCGDSTLASDVEALTGGQPVDLLWTDPPYGVKYEGKTKNKLRIENDGLDAEHMQGFLLACFSLCFATLKPGAAAYVAHADSSGHLFRSAFVEVGFSLKQVLIWKKDSMVMGRQDYQWQHEPILYGWKPGAPHAWFSDRKQTTIIEFDRPKRSTEHPTMKPVALVEYCLRNSSPAKATVYDPFGGSGTTLIACEANDRRCVTMELDPRYCDVIVERWEAYTGRKATRLTEEAACRATPLA